MSKIIKDQIMHCEKIAIKNDDGTIKTYKELFREAEEYNKRIWKNKKNLIFVLCDQSIECLSFIYEMIIKEQVPLLLGADIQERFVGKLINQYRPSYIFCKQGILDFKTYQVGTIDVGKEYQIIETNYIQPRLHKDLALLISTSGSTGSGKLVRLCYENLLADLSQETKELSMDSADVGLTPMPVQFIFGLCFCLWHWYVGASVLVTCSMAISDNFEDLFIREKVTCFAAVPHTWEMLERVGFWNEEKIQGLKFAMIGGGRMPDNLYHELYGKLGNRFWVKYGQTECSPGITLSNEYCLGSVGKALKNIEICCDVDSGELIVKGRCVCMGYAEDAEDLMRGDDNSGVKYTGDIGEIDEDGFVYLKGRKSRFIKIVGKRYSLDEIETLIFENFDLAEIACAGEDDDLKVYYVSNNKEDLLADITSYLYKVLGIPVKMIKLNSIEKLPRSSAEKIIYGELG